MSRKRQIVPLPTDLILDGGISSNAKVVYAVLRTLPKDKVQAGSATVVTVTHREITGKSNLSHQTVVKSLARLELTGWIIQVRSAGAANRYVFTTPVSRTGRIA